MEVFIMDVVEEIKFPTTDNEWVTKVLVGGILSIIPIVNFVVGGYYLKVLKGAIEGRSAMPKWEDWGNLFINGLVAFVIILVYMIIPILIIVGTAGLTVFSLAYGDMGPGVWAEIGAAILGITIGGILALILGFLIPMALAMYVKEGSIGAAFRIGEVVSRIRSVLGDYLIVYIILLALGFILSIIANIPILGWLILIFGEFYILAVGANMYGKLYPKSTA